MVPMISNPSLLVRGVDSPLVLASAFGNTDYGCELLATTLCGYSVLVVCDNNLLFNGFDVPSDYQSMICIIATDITCQCQTFSLLLCV
jgi:hypothetical protein